ASVRRAVRQRRALLRRRAGAGCAGRWSLSGFSIRAKTAAESRSSSPALSGCSGAPRASRSCRARKESGSKFLMDADSFLFQLAAQALPPAGQPRVDAAFTHAQRPGDLPGRLQQVIFAQEYLAVGAGDRKSVV